MSTIYRIFFLLAVCAVLPCTAATDPSPGRLKALYNSLDPLSISQHLAFYDLYPGSYEGQLALRDAYRLLSGNNQQQNKRLVLPPNMSSSLNAIVSLVNKLPSDTQLELSDSELDCIYTLAYRLSNRKLKGWYASSEEEVLQLPPEEIDLARGVLLSQMGSDPKSLRAIRSYEASIDLMALQILARLSPNATPKDKIRAINNFIFIEMGFRFPPHSTYAKDVDLYTFLPSVLDSRRGVCLGVSILYIAIAQRLDLPLEIVTPPGHIYVRWRGDNEEINIETTARGINLPSEEYLSVDTRLLMERNIKETIGMAHVNQASVYWEYGQHEKAINSYKKAIPYMPGDKHVIGLMAYACLAGGFTNEAHPLITQIKDYISNDAVSKDTLAEDYLNGDADAEAVKAVFMRVSDDRQSLLDKRDALQISLKRYPKFREGLFSLAGTWLQLHRTGEALETLEKYHALDPNNASVEYYLAELYKERLHYNKAWQHLRQAETLTKERDHEPKVLLEFAKELSAVCPE